MSETAIYIFKTLSNLHAGAGDRSFGIIDKHVQKDHATGLPVVFGSAVKGALRELVECQDLEKDKEEDKIAANLFGANDNKTIRQGELSFSDARLLVLPVRSNRHFFYRATTPTLLKNFAADLEHRKVAHPDAEVLKAAAELSVPVGRPYVLTGDAKDVYLEFWRAESPPEGKGLYQGQQDALSELLGERVALLHDNDFKALVDDLPVVARNSLNNGISTQLWYEEVVPRKAVFYCCVEAVGPENKLSDLDNALQAANHFVQLGGNATVGYGRTEWRFQTTPAHA